MDEPALHPAWRRWALDNLLLGAPAEALTAALVAQGVPEALAAAATQVDPLLLELARARLAQRGQLHALLSAQEPEELPSLEAPTREFSRQHVSTLRPARLRGVAADWPALGWSFQGLAERLGGVEVEVWDTRGAPPADGVRRSERFRRVPFDAFLEAIQERPRDDLYLLSRNRNLRGPLRPLLEDLGPQRAPLDPARAEGNSRLWIGPEGSHTRLHHDRSHILFVQLLGRKRLWLVSPASLALLDDVRGVYAALDARDGIPGAHVHSLELGPGDAVFLPAGWWHQVLALSPSISASFTNLEGLGDNHFAEYRLDPEVLGGR